MEIPDDLICLLRNLYAGQKATVRTGHGIMHWFKIGESISRLYIFTLLIFTFTYMQSTSYFHFYLYTEYITQNDRLNEAQAGNKTAGRNINNFRYADNTKCMAENKEKLKSLLMKMKGESETIGLKLNILVPSLHGK